MYGISNSQQQGGGGGGAASYTKIESKIAKADWVENTPSWIGQNALTWSVTNGMYAIQGGTEDLGLVEGGSYTTTVTIDGTDYNQSYSQVFSNDGMTVYLAYFNDNSVIMQIVDHCAGLNENGRPVLGNGYLVMVMVEGAASSVIIKSCSAISGSIEAIINNSAIKTNSAVTMYVDYAGKMSALKKIDGSLTVSVSTMPTIDISYAIEIVGTDTEGLFELVNGYIPPDAPTALPQKTSAIKTGTLPKGENYVQVTDSDITANSDIIVNVSYKKEITGDFAPGIFALSVSNDTAEEDIPFTYKVKQTDGKGQFTVVNSYIPQQILPLEKNVTNESTSLGQKVVTITGTAKPYLFTVKDRDVSASVFVRLYPADENTETWLNEHTLSSIITEESNQFTFKVDTNTLPTTFSITYVIENFM